MSKIILEVTGLKDYMKKRKKKFLSEIIGPFTSGLLIGLLAKPISQIIAYVYKNMRSKAAWACRRFPEGNKRDRCMILYEIKAEETIIYLLHQKLQQAVEPAFKNSINEEIKQRLIKIQLLKRKLEELTHAEVAPE